MGFLPVRELSTNCFYWDIHFILTMLDSCLIVNHNTYPYFYIIIVDTRIKISFKRPISDARNEPDTEGNKQDEIGDH